MGCRSKFVTSLVIFTLLVSGCVSLRIEKANIGNSVPAPPQLIENQSTLQDALKLYGAPENIIDMEGRVALIYEKGFYTGAQVSLGFPVSESAGPDLSLSGYGRLWKYDRLALLFSPDWVLISSIYVRGSRDPFFPSLFRDKETERPEKAPETESGVQRPLEP